MFPRRNRLSRHEFTAVSKDRTAKRAASPHFSGTLTKDPELAGVAVVVPKKAVRSAVKRNLVKRRVREAVRPWQKQPAGIILFARVGSEKLSYAEIKQEINTLLPQLMK